MRRGDFIVAFKVDPEHELFINLEGYNFRSKKLLR